MKASANNWDENNIDAQLFAYVEGDLTEEEVNRLEEKLATDTSLQTELEHWKESFVTQDFYATDKLEQSLLKEKVNPVNTASSIFIFITAIVASLLSFMPLSVEQATITDRMYISKPALLPEGKQLVEKQTAGEASEKEQIFVVPSNQYKSKSFTDIKTLPRKIDAKNLPIPSIIPIEAKPAQLLIYIPETHMKKLLAKKISGKRMISRQEQRKIIKMKERAFHQRQANEFLKGRIPYVVPLNTNNF